VHVADGPLLGKGADPDFEVDAHRPLVEEVLDFEAVDCSSAGFDELHVQPFRAGDLRLDVVARHECRPAVVGHVADERVDFPLAGFPLLDGVGPSTNVFEVDSAVVCEFHQRLQLFEPFPPGVAAVVGLRFEFADDGLRDDDGRTGKALPFTVAIGVRVGGNLCGHAAVDDHARVRDDFHTWG